MFNTATGLHSIRRYLFIISIKTKKTGTIVQVTVYNSIKTIKNQQKEE